MSNFGQIFSNIARSKPVSSYLQKLAPGAGQQVIVKRFQPKNSDQGLGTILECDLLVAQTNELRGWPFFLDAKGWGGQYQQAAAKQFIEAVMNSVDLSQLPLIGNQPHSIETIGEHLVSGNLRGVMIVVDVLPAMKKGAQQVGANGQPVYNAFWKPMKQTWQEVAQRRAVLDHMDGQAAPTPAPTQPAFGGFTGNQTVMGGPQAQTGHTIGGPSILQTLRKG